MKKPLTLFIATLLCMASAFAQGGQTGPLTWNLKDHTLTISGDGAMPDYYWGTSPPWYGYKDSIYTLILESGVASIGVLAFDGCSNLASITIPNSVTGIRDMAFHMCTSLTSLVTPNGLITIANLAFWKCSNLSSVFISKSVINIVVTAFFGCTNLASIEVDSENKSFSSENGILFNKNKTTLIYFPPGKTGAYTIPNYVTKIEDNAFQTCRSLTSITIPNSVESIGIGAFSSTGLTSVTIPNSVISMERAAFGNCTNLASVILSNNLLSIESSAFFGCTNLTLIIIPNSVKSIEENAFRDCTALTSITIPDNVTSIGDCAFLNCEKLKLITNLNPVPVDIKYYVFKGVNQSACTLEVPMESVSAYQNAEEWKNFKIKGIIVGVGEYGAGEVEVFPNPTTGELQVTSYKLQVMSIEVFDVYGRKLSHYSLLTTHYSINISHLPAGLYFVKVFTENGVFIEKVIKK